MMAKPYAVILGELLIINECFRWQCAIVESQDRMLDKSIELAQKAQTAADRAQDNAEWLEWVLTTSAYPGEHIQ